MADLDPEERERMRKLFMGTLDAIRQSRDDLADESDEVDEHKVQAVAWMSIGCLAFLLIIPSVLLNGFVFMKMWEWFVVPYFEIRPIGFLHAIGLLGMVRFVVWQHTLPNSMKKKPSDMTIEENKQSMTSAIGSLMYVFLIPAVALGSAYLIHWLIR